MRPWGLLYIRIPPMSRAEFLFCFFVRVMGLAMLAVLLYLQPIFKLLLIFMAVIVDALAIAALHLYQIILRHMFLCQ